MRAIRLVSVASIFLSAFLLFMVQPLVTRMLLPIYGGSPAVWNTALVFFQSLLLAGYLYAHVLSRLPSSTAVLLIHGSVMLVPLLLLPPTVPSHLVTGIAAGLWPGASLLGVLAALIAAPFFALSSNASLTQWWWSRSGAPGAHDPYWLYAASNVGSLLALLAYPFVLEPLFDLRGQAFGWTLGYVAFVALGLAAMLAAVTGRRGRAPQASLLEVGHTHDGLKSDDTVASGRIALWVARAAIGSSLLLSVTTQITTDLAPAPLLWVVPLALYLTTFVIGFGMADRIRRGPLESVVVVVLMAGVGILIGRGSQPFRLMLLVSLATLFFGALLCHRDLAVDRPAPRHLTAFYLWIAFGGALGGVLNGLVAPAIFDSVAEHPLTLMALALLLYADPERGLIPYRPSWRVGLLAALSLVWPLTLALHAVAGPAMPVVLLVVAGLWTLASVRYVGLVGITVWIACATILTGFGGTHTIAQERSFFGVVSIRDDGASLEMVHGSTVHGRQWKDPARRRLALPYYHTAGPLGSLVANAPPSAHIGVVGLGTGGLAASARPGQHVTFFEIDPVVERMAQTWFTYVADSPADVRIVLGDGRLALERVPDGTLDLLVVDAFSSDFVPIHLLTDEAIDLYLRKVTENGVVALHISNRHADLRRVVRGYALAHDTPVLFSDHSPSLEEARAGATRTLAVAFSPSGSVLSGLAASPIWTRFGADVAPVHWTDDHANLLAVLR